MNEKAEGRLISFFRFNKSLLLFPCTFSFYDFILDGSRTRAGAVVSSFSTRPTAISAQSRVTEPFVRKELPPNQNSFP